MESFRKKLFPGYSIMNPITYFIKSSIYDSFVKYATILMIICNLQVFDLHVNVSYRTRLAKLFVLLFIFWVKLSAIFSPVCSIIYEQFIIFVQMTIVINNCLIRFIPLNFLHTHTVNN